MKRALFPTRLIACAVLMGAMFAPGRVRAESMGDRIPAEAHVAFWVDDIAAARASIEKNSYYQLLVDEKLGIIGGPDVVGEALRRLPVSGADPAFPVWASILPMIDSGLRGGLESATSVFQFKVGELLDTFTGPLAMYSTLYDLSMSSGGVEVVEWDMILSADFKPEEREKVDRFLESALVRVPGNARKKMVSYSGHEYYHLEYFLDEQAALPGDRKETDLELIQEIPVIVEYGFVGETFLLAEGRGEPLKRAIRAMESGSETRLARKDSYRSATALLGDLDAPFHLYYDIPHHVNELRDHPRAERTLRSFQALGIHNAGPLVAGARLDESGLDFRAAVQTTGPATGILRVLKDSPQNKFERIGLVPRDALVAASLSIDFGNLYREYRAAMLVMSRDAQMLIDAAVRTLETIAKVSLQDDILAKSRGEMVSYVRPGPGEGSGISARYSSSFIFPIEGGTATTDAVNAVLRRLNDENTKVVDLEESEFMGNVLWETPQTVTQRGQGLYLSATPNGAVVASSGGELREIIRRLSGQAEGSIRDEAEFQRFLGGVEQRNLRGFVYQSSKAVIDGYLAKLSEESAEGDVNELRAELRRRLGDSWWLLRASDDGYLFTMTVRPPAGGPAQ